MEFNQPSEIVKDLTFGNDAQNSIMTGVDKLAKAVASTMGASGKCVIYEDGLGKPIVTKDGVTVANSVVLMDPVENIGATLIKEAAQKTVKEAGDGTTTATVLAHSILKEYWNIENPDIRKIKEDINTAAKKVINYLESSAKEVKAGMLDHVATISTNNDKELGNIIAEAYNTVGKDGVVLMEESETDKTYVDTVEGVQFDSGLKSQHLITDKEKNKAILEEPLVLIVDSEIETIRKIQSVLEYAIKNKKAILIIGNVSQQVMSALIMNKVKGNIKVNIIDPPGFSTIRRDMLDDLALITGAKVINEELGDDLDLIDESCLGIAAKVVTDENNTVIATNTETDEIKNRILAIEKQIKEEKNPYALKKLEQRKAMLSGSVGIIYVGADSKIELKEKKDRVEDAIYAVKAALKEGIVPGAGIALHNAADNISTNNTPGGNVLMNAIKAPYKTILNNAGIEYDSDLKKGWGINVVTGKKCNLIKDGIIDPVLVTKTALKNAISVATTIMSADCVISNVREQS
jgi:chaperonin GroEL